MRCTVCDTEMVVVDPSVTTHPTCVMMADDIGGDPFALAIKTHLIEMIKWAERESPRSKQQAIGPSEIGDPCDRRIGYKIAGIPEVNTNFDPWAAIVGTSIHSWLDDAITAWLKAHNSTSFITETPVTLNEFVKGRSDLYWRDFDCVIDHKGAGPDVMKKMVRHGPPPGYVVQVQLYGYGYEQLGYKVRKVALAFYPRAGWLRDMYVWTADYDRDVAQAALDRLSRIATELIERDVLNQSHRWEDVHAEPSNSCGFCPWFLSDRDSDRGANDEGCPGR